MKYLSLILIHVRFLINASNRLLITFLACKNHKQIFECRSVGCLVTKPVQFESLNFFSLSEVFSSATIKKGFAKKVRFGFRLRYDKPRVFPVPNVVLLV